jgi:hypothetical protein
MSQLNVGKVTASTSIQFPAYATANLPSNQSEGAVVYDSDVKSLKYWSGASWLKVGQTNNDGSSEAQAASSPAAILTINASAPNGLYWITIPTVGARQIYCDMTGGGWMLLMRGSGNDGLAYNDARWTDASESGRTNLHSNSYGSYAKDAAFYYYANASKIRIDAGGFSGARADGQYRTFTFDFTGTNTPAALMFTTQNRMGWGTGVANSRSAWVSTFGHDRDGTPVFERFGSTANHSIGNEGRGRRGCGQPMMFGYQASDSESASTNDVNSGLGTHPSYCGGSPGQFAGGSWMGNGGSVKIWAR